MIVNIQLRDSIVLELFDLMMSPQGTVTLLALSRGLIRNSLLSPSTEQSVEIIESAVRRGIIKELKPGVYALPEVVHG